MTNEFEEEDIELEASQEPRAFQSVSRYHVAEQIYIDEVGPKAKADGVINNSDFALPFIEHPQ